MRFSIIIPAYNSERYLEECLRSALSQSYRDYEVLVIDDGSTDSTPFIVDNYVNSNPNVRGFHIVNRGPLYARRVGMKNARGDYLLFLDSDDCLRSDALEVISDAIDRSDADLISFRASRDPTYSVQDCCGGGLPAGNYSGQRFGEVRKTVCEGRFNTLWGKAVKSSCIANDDPLDSIEKILHGEDLFQLLSILEKASSLYQIKNVLYYYRSSDASGTASFKASQLDDIVRVTRKLRAFAEGWGAECISASVIGEIEQYYYLLKINQLSSFSSAMMRANCRLIADVMRVEGVFDRIHLANLRIDMSLLMRAMDKGQFNCVRLILGTTELFKRVRARWGLASGTGFH